MPTSEEELKLRSEVNRGAEARAILDHDLVKSAFEAIEAYHLHSIRTSKAGDSASREEAYQMLRTLDQFKGLLTRVMETGKLAAATLATRAANERALRDEGL